MMSVGIDVSKSTLSCALGQEVRVFSNDPSGHEALLAWSSPAHTWCMEATGRYHEGIAQFGYQAGKRCLVVNPGRAKQYLAFVDSRAKTDRVDALALARMAEREGENLREYRPLDPTIRAARDIFVRRKALVQSRVSLGQVKDATGDPGGHLKSAIDALQASQKELERELGRTLKGYPSYQNLLSIPGIGPLSAALLVCTLERGEFATSDSLVAFAGLDPRARDSGKLRGQRRLSHQGDAQLRTMLFMAARTGARHSTWKPYYASQLAKGLSSTEATVILARKLIRVAWSIHRNGSSFSSKNETTLDMTT